MASVSSAASPFPGPDEFALQLPVTDTYFMRRRDQLAASYGVTPAESPKQQISSTDKERHSPTQSLRRVGPEVFPSPFKVELAAHDSPVAREFEELFAQARRCTNEVIFAHAEAEMDGLAGADLRKLRLVIYSQKRHAEALHEQLQQQHHVLQQQKAELQQREAEAAQASFVFKQQQEQLENLRADAASAVAAQEQQARALQQQQRRVAELEAQLEKCMTRSKEAAIVHQKDAEELQQLRQQQCSLVRQIRANKSGDSAAKEAAAAARHAAEIRKVASQRDTLVAVVKKQCKLIEILKQQKAHLEAARCLQFTEEEFLRVIDSRGSFKEHQQKQLQQQQQKKQLLQRPQQQQEMQQQQQQPTVFGEGLQGEQGGPDNES
ncbi:hypothetical protein Esti_006333 [Eimeria stiedai]